MFTRIDRNGQGVIHFGVDPSPDVDPVSLSAFLNISPWARPDMITTLGGKTSIVPIYLLHQYK